MAGASPNYNEEECMTGITVSLPEREKALSRRTDDP
jgi:hypothetical protein